MPKLKFYTLWIAIILVGIFILQFYIPNFTDFFILSKSSWIQPWRFATSIFLHGSFKHLISNLFVLIFFGLILEKLVGSNKFLGIYLVSGICANLIAINFYPSSLGSSGAIMGVIGALTIIRPTMNVWAFGMILPMSIATIFWVLIDALGIFIPSNIGHIAHLSGILFGAIFGVVFRLNHHKVKKKHVIEVPEHILRRWETIYIKN
ncbi:MAG: rhomboid family intramembrane serine protease [Nanoarchaeota archaeon]|nr:rhomboid family intramembrane serine protease [Nanoarchaeota archaeon]